MSSIHLVLFSTDTTEDRYFGRHAYSEPTSASTKVEWYRNNMVAGGDVQAYSWQELNIDDAGLITSVVTKEAKAKPFKKLTRYNQKKA